MDDYGLWGPPFVVQEDTLRKQVLRGREFWFDFRTDVLEENFQNERYCEQVWWILNEKKQDDHEMHSVSLGNHMDSSRSGDSHDIGSFDSDKTLSAILTDADTSSTKSDLDEDENTSSITDAQTIETRDSSNGTGGRDPDIKLRPQDPLTVEVVEDADTPSSPVLASKIEEVEEHSCSSLVTDQVLDPIKQAPENKSSSAISQENIGGSTLRPLLLEAGEKVREKKANAANEDGEVSKNPQQNDSLLDIVIASEPFTTESLLEMCDEPEKGRETSCDERSKRSQPEEADRDELIINLLTETRQKAESIVLFNPRSVLIKKRQSKSNSSCNKGMNTSFIRNTKQKVQGETGEINMEPVKKSTQSTPEIVRGSSVTTQHEDSLLGSVDGRSERGGNSVSDLVMSTSELKNKTGKELKNIAKALKVTHYYKLKKEDLLQRLTRQLNPS